MKQMEEERNRFNMKITFIAHSGFLVELEERYLLFDYFKGNIPDFSPEKEVYVFVSHKHQDHFNPEIFELAEKSGKVTYILSYDIKPTERKLEHWGVGEKVSENIVSVKADSTYQIEDMEVITYKSTDAGVAFLVIAEGKTIYHGGDLHWWHWEGEDKQWNNGVAADYKRQINKMTDVSIDVAFLPMDPRQEGDYRLGIDYMLQTVGVKYAFPMHLWEKYSLVQKFKQEGYTAKYDTSVIDIEAEGQQWNL